MKEAVRQRNEDPGQRSRDRQHWHEYDDMVTSYRKKFWIHIFFDVLIAVASVWLAIHFYAKRVQDEVTDLRSNNTTLQRQLSREHELLVAKDKQLTETKKLLSAAKAKRK